MKRHFEGGTRVFANLKDPFTSKEVHNNLFDVSNIYNLTYLKNYSCVQFAVLKPIDDNRFKSYKSVKVMHDD